MDIQRENDKFKKMLLDYKVVESTISDLQTIQN